MNRLLPWLSVALLAWAGNALVSGADQPPLAKAPFAADQAKESQTQWAKHIRQPLVHTNSIGMRLTLIPPGEFMMGSTEEQMRQEVEDAKGGQWYVGVASGRSIELPSHRVRITKPFYMGSTEVTVAQFRQFADASGYKTEAEQGLAYGQPANRKLRTWRETFYQQADDHPVLQLCLRDCREFCKWLSKKEGVEYYVPTEAQWEYACRAGTSTPWYFAGDNDEYEKVIGEYAWMSWDRKKTPSPVPVGQRRPNAFGLYDMHGNVWEYVNDWYHEFYYKESPLNDPTGPATFNEMRDGRVMIRGGSFDWADSGARSAIRMRIRQDSNQHPHMGFRVAMRIKGVEGVPLAVDTRPAVREDWDPKSVKTRDPVEAQQAAATDKLPKQLKIDLGGGASMEFVLIPPGTFLMGSAGGLRDERPLHKVTISKPFYIGKYEVTQGQWEAVLGEDQRLVKAKKNPRLAKAVVGPNKSMNGLSWKECRKFVEALSAKVHGRSSRTRESSGDPANTQDSNECGCDFALPTEAQWEYACRAGSRTEYYFGDDVAALGQHAKFCADDALPLRERDPLDMTAGTKRPNAWGLYDMHGSMWEWCSDWYAEDYYAGSPVVDPRGPDTGLLHVLRGGSWFRYGKYARSAYRHRGHPDATSSDFGFRLVINLPAGRTEGDDSAKPNSRPDSPASAGTQDRKVSTKHEVDSGEGRPAVQPVARSGDRPQHGGRPQRAVNYNELARSLVRYPNNPVIRVGEEGTWDDQTLGCFTVLDAGDKLHFYSGGAQYGKPKNIGMATSRDGIHWTKYEKNPLFPGSMPYAIKVGDTFRLYHPGNGGLQMRTSQDGFRWSEPTRVLAGGIMDPCIVRANGRYYLYYCGGGKITKNGKQVWEFKAYMATSEDGINWKKKPKPALPLGPKGSWDDSSHAGPCVLKLDDSFHMWYLGSGVYKGHSAWRIGHATSPDGLNWTKSGTEPVLNVGQPRDWDCGTFMSFDIIFRDGKFLFWYAAAPTGHGDETRMTIQIGHGTSR